MQLVWIGLRLFLLVVGITKYLKMGAPDWLVLIGPRRQEK